MYSIYVVTEMHALNLMYIYGRGWAGKRGTQYIFLFEQNNPKIREISNTELIYS